GSTQNQPNSQGQAIQVQGKIQSVRNLELLGFTGEHKEHVLARIKTDQGENIRADLGPRSGLSDLNLKEGESVSVQGTVGTINDRPVLMADEVSAGGKTAQVRLPEGLGHRRIHAQILSTRTANLKKQDGEQMIAHLRLLNGQQVDALLGPKDKLGDLNIHEGDSLDILAHPGQLNSEPVLVAEQVHLGGKVVDINRPQGQDDQQFNTQDSGSSDANNSK
ncbi:MAG TPA: hypothetical protein VFT74_05510, partial [Isosphaeraceae bacterium]|nr:hypothetical protein [Isosphaeraceae bacterium]